MVSEQKYRQAARAAQEAMRGVGFGAPGAESDGGVAHGAAYAAHAATGDTQDTVASSVEDAAEMAARVVARAATGNPRARPDAAEKRAQAKLLREVIGNPHRPTVLRADWLNWNDGLALRLAWLIDEKEEFDQMPVLADALEEAGCTDQEVLAHCRSGERHGPGCWVLDVILRRE
jgi:hypothetical protein